jgi:hypothetical protein
MVGVRTMGMVLQTQGYNIRVDLLLIPWLLGIATLIAVVCSLRSRDSEKAIRESTDWEAWDRQIEQDASSGKLDFLVDEAMAEKKQE